MMHYSLYLPISGLGYGGGGVPSVQAHKELSRKRWSGAELCVRDAGAAARDGARAAAPAHGAALHEEVSTITGKTAPKMPNFVIFCCFIK